MERLNPNYLDFGRLNARGAEAMQLTDAVLRWYKGALSCSRYEEVSALVIGLGLWKRVEHRVYKESMSIVEAITAEKAAYTCDIITNLNNL